MLNGTAYDLTNPALESDVSEYRQLASCSAPGLMSDQMRQVYFSGKAAMMLDGTFGLPSIETEGKASVKKNTAMVTFPVAHQVTYVSSSLQIPATLSATDKQLAWEFIEQVTTPPPRPSSPRTPSPPPADVGNAPGLVDPVLRRCSRRRTTG